MLSASATKIETNLLKLVFNKYVNTKETPEHWMTDSTVPRAKSGAEVWTSWPAMPGKEWKDGKNFN